MEKVYEIRGCVEVPREVSEDEFLDKFIGFVEENGGYFGGGTHEVTDGVCLIANDLEIRLIPKVFADDIQFPVNTSLSVAVESDGYCANAIMDIDIKQLVTFAEDLKRIYDTLSGEAKLEEPYGKQMYISFTGSGKGHIAIKGFLKNENSKGCQQTLEFENDIDQTELKEFYLGLFDICNKYSLGETR